MEKQHTRRLYLLIVMTLLGAAAGFVWGHWYGYSQGKADTLKAIEKRLNEPQPGGQQV